VLGYSGVLRKRSSTHHPISAYLVLDSADYGPLTQTVLNNLILHEVSLRGCHPCVPLGDEG